MSTTHTPSVRSVASSSSTRTSPDEVTALLPPSTHSHPHAHAHPHGRKASVGGRSVSGRSTAGSVRGYGAVNGRHGPAAQAPRVSKQGQRRILTTLPLQAAFFSLVLLTFASFVLTIILFLNTVMDFSIKFLPYRGSGFAEFWVSLIGSWISLGGVLFFSHPSYLFFLTTLIALLLHIPIILLVFISKPLRLAHSPLILIPLTLTALTLVFTLLSNYLVRRAKMLESQRICRMLTDAAGRERAGDENVARALVGVQGRGFWGRIFGFIGGLVGLIAGLAGVIVVTLLLIDFSISAYDGSLPLPSPQSALVRVQPDSAAWPVNVHIACTPAPSNSSLPTVIYTSPSGVPGSLALFPSPLVPSGIDATNPGRWIFDLQEKDQVGRVCTWDRPGYGFSDVLGGADLGIVADSLWLALKGVNETDKSRGLVMVGEGYGGLVSRVLASRHSLHIHSMLHLEAQTASTYFSDPPTTTFLSRLISRLPSSLITPLSLSRLPSVLLRRSNSLSRILASSHPSPNTVRLNEKLQKARLQETIGSLSRSSASFRALLESGRKYPAGKKAIVISSKDRMNKDGVWAEGQRVLAEEVTSEEGLLSWAKVEGVGHFVCEGQGRRVCEDSLKKLLRA